MTTVAFPRRRQDLEGFYASSQLPAARGATAGIPGAWTPAGSVPPATVADLAGGRPFAVVASPATAWTSGQYVQTRTAGAAGRASWSGSTWVSGAAPLEDPGSFTIAELEAWVEENPDATADLLAAEQARGDAARVTLVAWLENRLEAP